MKSNDGPTVGFVVVGLDNVSVGVGLVPRNTSGVALFFNESSLMIIAGGEEDDVGELRLAVGVGVAVGVAV